MTSSDSSSFVSRGGLKLSFALESFGVNPEGLVCADLGCHVGGFTDCLLQNGALRVHAVDTGYGILAWKLRKDSRVVVHERTNAMHVQIGEKIDLVSVDVGWTRQRHILPHVLTLGKERGHVISLIKPHYETGPAALVDGVLPAAQVTQALSSVEEELEEMGIRFDVVVESPILGNRGNTEFLGLIAR